jgi:hypothetical protein
MAIAKGGAWMAGYTVISADSHRVEPLFRKEIYDDHQYCIRNL